MSEASSRVFLDTNVLYSALLTERGTPARLLHLAAAGRFQAVISANVVDELVRNVRRKAPEMQSRLRLLFDTVDFEVLPLPSPADTEPWLQAGFRSDSSVIAAALGARLDYFCTGDAGFRSRLASHDLPFRVLTPAELARELEP